MEEWETQPRDQRQRLTKPPLSSEQTEILINTAISLHNSAISHEIEKRWWVPTATALIGAVLGFISAIIAMIIKLPVK